MLCKEYVPNRSRDRFRILFSVTMTQQKFGRSAVVVPSKSVCMWERKALLETLERLNGTDAVRKSGKNFRKFFL